MGEWCSSRIRTDRYRYTDECPLLQCWANVVDEVAEYDTDGHSEEDPDRQEAVEEAEALEG